MGGRTNPRHAAGHSLSALPHIITLPTVQLFPLSDERTNRSRPLLTSLSLDCLPSQRWVQVSEEHRELCSAWVRLNITPPWASVTECRGYEYGWWVAIREVIFKASGADTVVRICTVRKLTLIVLEDDWFKELLVLLHLSFVSSEHSCNKMNGHKRKCFTIQYT